MTRHHPQLRDSSRATHRGQKSPPRSLQITDTEVFLAEANLASRKFAPSISADQIGKAGATPNSGRPSARSRSGQMVHGGRVRSQLVDYWALEMSILCGVGGPFLHNLIGLSLPDFAGGFFTCPPNLCPRTVFAFRSRFLSPFPFPFWMSLR